VTKKLKIESTTPEEITSIPEVATLAKAEEGVKIKKNLFIACSMKDT
jgi:hypothetical protein